MNLGILITVIKLTFIIFSYSLFSETMEFHQCSYTARNLGFDKDKIYLKVKIIEIINSNTKYCKVDLGIKNIKLKNITKMPKINEKINLLLTTFTGPECKTIKSCENEHWEIISNSDILTIEK
ncbi:MAG: hypothetical protein H6622_02145 [Halobacteriovoraceae bacterium]|nr:hypothetical protein [Halobacteriovoraceae bacterium]